MLSHFDGTRRDFVAGLLSQSRQAKIWFYLDIDRAVQQLNTDRGRVVRAMDFLAERGWMELKTSKVQHCYARLKTPDDLNALAAELHEHACGVRTRNWSPAAIAGIDGIERLSNQLAGCTLRRTTQRTVWPLPLVP